MKNATKSDGPYHALFLNLGKQLDAHNDKRERLVRASRDVTVASKKVIFELHRANASNKSNVLEHATQAIDAVRDQIAKKIAVEMDEGSEMCFHKCYSPGMQEFVEAREMLQYMKEGKLAGITHLQGELTDACQKTDHGLFVRLEEADYVLGVADLTGECMRMAVQRGGKGEVRELSNLREFVHDIWVYLSGLEKFKMILGKDFDYKMRTLNASLEKVEKSFYGVTIRKAEFKGAGKQDEKRRRLT